jgi:hypothetical protein
MARRPLGAGWFGLRSMVSLEPLTIRGCGYPDLLATGELCDGDNIHDRQHPHGLFMEVAAEFDRPLTRSVRWQVYGALAGEPALGPPAFPHRVSAMPNPIAPIKHHWLDATRRTSPSESSPQACTARDGRRRLRCSMDASLTKRGMTWISDDLIRSRAECHSCRQRRSRYRFPLADLRPLSWSSRAVPSWMWCASHRRRPITEDLGAAICGRQPLSGVPTGKRATRHTACSSSRQSASQTVMSGSLAWK